MSRRPQQVFDPALQQERTALAWDRTGVALIVAGALFVRAGAPPYHELRHAPGLLAIVVGAAVILLAYQRYERLHGRLHTGARVSSARLVVAIGLFTVAFSASALILVLFGG